VSDTDTALVDSLKVLDPERPIREATELLRRREMTRGANKRHRAVSDRRHRRPNDQTGAAAGISLRWTQDSGNVRIM